MQKSVVNDVSTTVQTENDTPVPRKELVTASAGIAIAHHYTSLSYVRRISKEAERLAKEHYGRNALVVTVLRRSGEQTRVGCKWLYPGLTNEAQQPMRLFAKFSRISLLMTYSLHHLCIRSLRRLQHLWVFLELHR